MEASFIEKRKRRRRKVSAIHRGVRRYFGDKEIVSVKSLVKELRNDIPLLRQFQKENPGVNIKDEAQMRYAVAMYLHDKGYRKYSRTSFINTENPLTSFPRYTPPYLKRKDPYGEKYV